uniref:Ig-like domain-containing protein n=1 Tax=Neovison vison TaxID=452646 RepID=A0A8C7BFQ7_NEOVI
MTPTFMALLCLGLCPSLCFLPGTLPKPTIWAEPSSVMPWGTPVTIWCQGSLEAQEYHLHKEGDSWNWEKRKPLESGYKAGLSGADFPLGPVKPSHGGRYTCYGGHTLSSEWSHQAEFPMSPVTSAHGGTYRCYGSASTSPYLLSQPSDPLELLVSAPARGPHWYLYILIVAAVAFILLLGLLVCLQVQHQDRSKGRTLGEKGRG